VSTHREVDDEGLYGAISYKPHTLFATGGYVYINLDSQSCIVDRDTFAVGCV
jgi:hypothetical protein